MLNLYLENQSKMSNTSPSPIHPKAIKLSESRTCSFVLYRTSSDHIVNILKVKLFFVIQTVSQAYIFLINWLNQDLSA
jgi:hypothetical protein